MTEGLNFMEHLSKLKERWIYHMTHDTEAFRKELQNLCEFQGKVCIPIDDVEKLVAQVASQIQASAKPFKDILKHIAEKHPDAWENVKIQMENEKWVKLSDVKKALLEGSK